MAQVTFDKTPALQCVTTRYHGPTNTLPSRISARCEAKTIFLSYDHANSIQESHELACRKLVEMMGWTGHYVAGANRRGYTFVNTGSQAKGL